MPQPLASKEASLFRHLVKDFEAKQYKKGLKAAEQILKKNPNHGDTQAMKALILNSMGQSDEAFALAKIALKNDMKSHVCWHVYGILWRSVRNNEEAIKAYRFALRLEPESPQILRDLSMLQVQVRDFQGYVQSRKTMLHQRSQVRLNWTAMAMAHHLAGDLKSAEHVLATYEGTLKSKPPKLDSEHSEAVLYKNTIIAESGDIQRALEHLESIAKDSLDKTAVMELRARYLLELGKNEEAEKAYRALIHRNPEYRAYYEGLERSVGLDSGKPDELSALYASIAAKYPRVDAARRIPLDFLSGESADFKKHADQYLRNKLRKGVPSTFNNVKSLYGDKAKLATIQQLVEGYAAEAAQDGVNGDSNKEETDIYEPSIYFLAQHYNYKLSRDLKKSSQYVDKCIELSPKTYDYHMMRARIAKHAGNPEEAATLMNKARELDLKDRYINTKCAKYQLRNNENEAALDTMSKFTRNEVVGGTLGDLTDMQSIWFLTEDGEAHIRNGDYGLGLKRFHTVKDLFDIWEEDQYDFHTFSLRKGQIRAYIDMLRWEDTLRNHPFYVRIAIDAARAYVDLHDKPELKEDKLANGVDPNDPKAVKKAKKEAERKEREEAERQEAERKAAAAKKANPDGDVKKPDEDPKGKKFLANKDPLGAATQFLAPLLELNNTDIEVQHAGFEVYIRKEKYLLALKCLLAAFKANPQDAVAHEQAIRFRIQCKPCDANNAALEIANSALPELYRDPTSPLNAANDKFASQHAKSAPHQFAAIKARAVLDNTAESNQKHAKEAVKMLESASNVTVDQALAGAALLRHLLADKATRDDYVKAARSIFPDAAILDREAQR